VANRSDAELLREARSRPAAFAQVYERHARRIHAFLAARASVDVASELTAETFAQAALSLRRFRDEFDGSALPWLYGIARNLLRRYYEDQRIASRARERLGMPLTTYDLDLDAEHDRLDAKREHGALAAAIADLSESHRDALRLRILDERPYADVATSLGCSQVAARIRVSRALGALSRALRGTG
jgi:RNA polymerase sigma factor (sigma-70 family)